MDSKRTMKLLQKFLTILSVVAMIVATIPVSEARIYAEDATIPGETTTVEEPPVADTPLSNEEAGSENSSGDIEIPTAEEATDIVNEFLIDNNVTVLDENGNQVQLQVALEGDEPTQENTNSNFEIEDPEFYFNNDWIDPDYDSFLYSRDAEIMSFIEVLKSFEDKNSLDFANFLVDNTLNIMDLSYLLGKNDTTGIEIGDVDFSLYISAQELYECLHKNAIPFVNNLLISDENNPSLKKLQDNLFFCLSSVIEYAFPNNSELSEELELLGAVDEVLAVDPSFGKNDYCNAYYALVDKVNYGTRVPATISTSGFGDRSGYMHFRCSSSSCSSTQVNYNDPTGAVVARWTKWQMSMSEIKSAGGCKRCGRECGLETCQSTYKYYPGGTGEFGVAIVWNMNSGDPVYCVQPNIHITSCSVYYGTTTKETSGDAMIEIAYAIQQAKGTSQCKGPDICKPSDEHIHAAKCVWKNLGIRDTGEDCSLPTSANNSMVRSWPVNMGVKNSEGISRTPWEMTDGNSNLDRLSGYLTSITLDSRNFKLSSSGNLTAEFIGSHKIKNTITDPYPLKKSVIISPVKEKHEIGSLAEAKTITYQIGSDTGWSSDGGDPQGQNYVVEGQFEPGNYKADRWFGDSYNVYQKSGAIKFDKYSERTLEKVSCPYVDVFGVSHNCNTAFSLYMEVNESSPTWQAYKNTSIDMGPATDVTYEGKTYRKVQISSDGSGSPASFQSVWELANDGTVTIGANSTYVGTIPEGVFYVKEVRTNNRIWDLNPKFYRVDVVDGQVKAITSGTDSNDNQTGNKFYQEEYGALEIAKFTAEHTTTSDHTSSRTVPETALTTNSFTDGFNNTFDYKARFRLYIDSDSPLWDTEYDYSKIDPSSKIAKDAINNNANRELHALRINQDPNNDSNTGQYEFLTDGNWTWEWQTNNGIVKINSIPVKKYSDKVDSIKVYVKEVWVNTDFQALDRDYHPVIVEKNAKVFTNDGTNYFKQVNDLYASLEIDKYIASGFGKNLDSYPEVHASDSYEDSYKNTYDSVFTFALYIDKDNLLWGSEYDCTASNPDKCPAIPVNDTRNNTGKELHQVRIYKLASNKLEPEVNLIREDGKIYEYKWTTVDGHIDITQIPIFPRNYVDKEVSSGTFYLKEIFTNEVIFDFITDYRPVELSLNTNTRVKVVNEPMGSLEVHKFDEDSMPDGTPRKVTSDYCSESNIEQGTYCDVPENKALSDYFVLLIDDTSPLWNLSKEESDRLFIGAYDAGAYYAYDEDWGGLGYINSVSLAKDDKHDYQGSAQNSAKSGSEMYEIDFSQNESDAKLHVVAVKGVTAFTGTDLVDASIWSNLSGGFNSDTGNVNKYTQNITEKYEDGNERVFKAGVHWHPDANGDLYIKYLPAGSYYLKEHSVDPNVFSLDEYIYSVEIENTKTSKVRNLVASELDPAPEWTFANTSIKTGGLEFVKLDEEGYNAGAGHKFRIWYVNDKVLNKKEAQENGNSIQNSKGQWGKDISNSYELARTISAKKKYLSGYLANGKQIPVDENDNRLVLFQINYDKAYFDEHPGYYKYKGTGAPIDVFETNEDGRIYIERLPIGTYIIEEIETREDVYDFEVDDKKTNGIFEDFKVYDDQDKMFQNSYRFSVDYKLVTCLNSKTNKAGKHSNVCTMIHQFKNKNNTQVPSGLFADTATRTNEVKVGEHNAEVTTTFSFDSTLKTKETLTGIVNEWAPERGSLELTKYDEYGNTGSPWDIKNKVFELYYLDHNDAFDTITGNWFVHNGTYSPEDLPKYYNVPEEILSRLRGKVLAVQVDNVQKEGVYNFKHWNSSSVKFDNGEENDAVYQFITGADGKIKIDQVPVGEYLVIEVGTTNAFLINVNGETVVDVKNGKTTEQDIVNYYRNVDLEIQKQSELEEIEPLDDARFVVYDITDTFKTDYASGEADSENLIFARTNNKIDLYNLLIANTPYEAQVQNKTLKYSLDNVDYAYVDSDRYLIAGDSGKVKVTVMYGVHSLYGNLDSRTIYTGMNLATTPVKDSEGNWIVDRVSTADIRFGNVEVEPGYELKLYKDAALTEPVTIQNVQVDGVVAMNVPGTYTLNYRVVSADHVVYNFERQITVVERDRTACLYYPQSGAWLQDRNNAGQLKKCAEITDRDPVYKAGPYEGTFDGNKSITLIPAASSAEDNGKVLETFDIYVLKDGSATTRIIEGAAGTKPAIKVFEGITGHVTIQLQDYQDHNYPIKNGKLVTYKDPELTQKYKTYNADELGMVDLTNDVGKVEKLYFSSKVNPDGYYSDIENVVEIDMSAARPGYLQIKNLKHSRKYVVCEVETPNGYDFNNVDNICSLIDTGITGEYGEEYENGKRKIYNFTDNNILFTLNSTIENVDTVNYEKVANATYSEDNFDKMIAERNAEYDLWGIDSGVPHLNEEKLRAVNNEPITQEVKIYKEGSIDNALLNSAVFDLYEVYSTGEKLLGRYSTGAIFQHFQDDEGNPIVDKKVVIATDTTVNSIGEVIINPDTIVAEVMTDENGNAFYSGLPNGSYVFALERPLKDGYYPCRVTTIVDEYCNPSPSDNDYVPFADLAMVYKEIFEANCNFGQVLLEGLKTSSTYKLVEVIDYEKYGHPYIIPDDDIVYEFTLDYSNMDFNQGMFVFTVTNHPDMHEMGTQLTSAEHNKEVAISENMQLVDVVHQKGLKPGVEYELRAVLMDKKTNKPFIDADGNEVRVTVPNLIAGEANEDNGVFTTEDWEVTFTFNGTNIKEDTELVAFEQLFNSKFYEDAYGTTYKGRLIDSHEDINDEGQTVKVVAPKIGTTASNPEDGSQVLTAKLFEEEPFAIKDVVSIEGAVPGKQYKLVGWLMDKSTNNKVVVDAKPIQDEIIFTADKMNFEKEMTFNVPGEILVEDGHKFVVFEHMYELVKDPETGEITEKEFAEHEDINDEGQTITVKIVRPEIKTKAADIRDDDQKLEVYSYSNEELTIKDTISYDNLKPEYKYIVKTSLVDAETGDVLVNLDKSEAKAEKEVEVTDKTGVFDVEIKIDSKPIAEKGYKFVIFEELYVLFDLDKDGVPEEHFVAEHKDLTDTHQTIEVGIIEPKIRTKARDAADNDSYIEKDVYENDIVTINDTVIYENLKPGEKYIARAYAVNKATGKELLDKDGNKITAEKEFTANASGEVVVEGFKISVKEIEDGAIIVMFEELFHLEEVPSEEDPEKTIVVEELITEHKDINDKDQSLEVFKYNPSLKTKLAFLGGAKKADTSKETIVIDVVEYKDFKPNTEYRMVGQVFDKDTKKLVAEGETIFKTEAAEGRVSGTVEVEINLGDTRGKEGKLVIAFEDAYEVRHPEWHVGEHRDWNDADQTVEFNKTPEPTPTPEPKPNTGSGNMILPIATISIISLISLLTILRKKRFN